MSNDFKLCAELAGHSKDVRCLAETVFPENGIVSGSRDHTARIWSLGGPAAATESLHCLKGHKGFVSAVYVAPPDSTYPLGRIFTGSQDKAIRVYVSDPPECLFTLEGHKDTVCCLTYDSRRNVLVSSSWDCTVRVWSEQSSIATLEGHEAAVWTVAIVPDEEKTKLPTILSGSADKTIKLWVNGAVTQTYQGHTDCVRGVVVLPMKREFLSCGNDAVIRRWNLDSPTSVQQYSGHSNYIYCISILPGGTEFITGSEDRTLRVWSVDDAVGNDKQRIDLPAQSIWSVLALSNGDIVAGSSDGAVRVFSRIPDRQASQDTLEAFDAVVKAFMDTLKKDDELGGIKISDLPGPEALMAPGERDGQTKMVRLGATVELHEWSGAENKWNKVGDVLSAKGPAEGKQMHLGQEYDYVFDVDVEEGKPPLKLPFNNGDDPYVAAQRFIDKHMLPQVYLDQVAHFVITNAKGAGVGGGGPTSNGFVDPLTGSSRYVPGSGTGQAPSTGLSSGDFSDPFTGAGRYVPGAGSGINGPKEPGAPADPFTGGSRYVPSGASVPARGGGLLHDPKRPRSDHIPIREFIMFTSVNAKSWEKLKEFHGTLPAENQFPEDWMKSLHAIAVNSDAFVEANLIKAFEKGLCSWPTSNLVPLLDLFQQAIRRIRALNDHFFVRERGRQLLDQLIGYVKSPSSRASGAPSPSAGIIICIGRLLSNGFAFETGQKCIAETGLILIPVLFESGLSLERPSAQCAAGSVIANYAHFLYAKSDSPEQRAKLCQLLYEQLAAYIDRPIGTAWCQDALLLLARSLGTLMWGDDATIKAAKTIVGLDDVVVKLKDRIESDDGKHDARCIERMLGRF